MLEKNKFLGGSKIRIAGGALVIASLALAFGQGGAVAGPFVFPTPEMDKYLVIATGEGSTGNEFASFQQSNVEIGADQEVISNSSVGSPSQRVGSYNGGLEITSWSFGPISMAIG